MVTTRAFMLSRPLLVVSIGLVVIAAACAGWFGWSWHQSSASASTVSAGSGAAGARLVQEVLKEGEEDVQNFNTLSYTDLSQGRSNWLASSTGVLRAETASGWAGFAKAVAKARTTTTATVLDAALTSLNARTAGIIVALQLTVTPAKGVAATKRTRLEGTLTKTSSGWKLSALGQVPVGPTQATAP